MNNFFTKEKLTAALVGYLENLSIGAMLVAWLPVFAAWFSIFLLSLNQVFIWFKDAHWIDVDLYFLIAQTRCADTKYQAMGIDGMTICRRSGIEFTSWKGVDQILDWFFELHLIFSCIIATVFWVIPWMLFFFAIANVVDRYYASKGERIEDSWHYREIMAAKTKSKP
jgi:hypothetical protein